MNLGLAGRVALVFGGSRGIGAATARALAEEGVSLALTARSIGALAPILSELPDALPLVADLTEAGSAEQAVAQALQHFGRIDCAVVSAGAAQGGSFLALDDTVWEQALALKFMGLVRALRAVLPPMIAAQFGRVVVIVGNNGRQPSPALLPGSAANAACLAVVRGLADDVCRHNIRINALNPGPTRTDRWDTMIGQLADQAGRGREAIEAEMLAKQPLGRIATAAEMGQLATMLLSDAADMLVGASLTADGGATKGIG